ncbi:radical SAM protein [Candidatus Aminicenantes bacterium AH-873-B07]|nr:radical SAM protein [Candidatus Aminicenantes bacterium AH-873-B07]
MCEKVIQTPLQYVFTTEKGNKYIYDACTSNVYPVNDNDLIVINYYLKEKSIDKEVLLSNQSYKELEYSIDKVTRWIEYDKAFSPCFRKFDFLSEEEFITKIDNVQQLTLEVTQRCNLRCKYCIYRDNFDGHRSHGDKDMDWRIAKKSIDYFVERINSQNRIQPYDFPCALSFYGGEPFINFRLIEKCVNYISGLKINGKIRFNLTTNATLIDNEIAKFLIDNDFSLLISLDGPKSEHDKNRVYKNGEGTFDIVIRNVENLFYRDGEYFRKNVSFNAVHTYNTDLEKVFEFFENLILKYNMKFSIRFDLDTTNKNVSIKTLRNHYTRYLKLREEYIKLSKKKVDEHAKSNRHYILDQFFKLDFLRLKKRCYQNPSNIKITAGACIPGSRRIYVDVYGNFHMCEKIDHTFKIGDWWKGVDYQKVKSIWREFQKEVLSKCKNCINLSTCNICMAAVGKKGKFVTDGLCENNCNAFKRNLKDLFNILECNPKAFDRKIKFEDLI